MRLSWNKDDDNDISTATSTATANKVTTTPIDISRLGNNVYVNNIPNNDIRMIYYKTRFPHIIFHNNDDVLIFNIDANKIYKSFDEIHNQFLYILEDDINYNFNINNKQNEYYSTDNIEKNIRELKKPLKKDISSNTVNSLSRNSLSRINSARSNNSDEYVHISDPYINNIINVTDVENNNSTNV
jgi:hypothetical protein